MSSKAAQQIGWQGLVSCGLIFGTALGAAAAQPAASDQPAAASSSAPASSSVQPSSVKLGGHVILTLRATAGGMTPQQRVDTIDARLSDLLGTPNIKPKDVVVYTPKGKAPVIYALGRRLITVDAATAKAEGEGKKPLELAEIWAKTLQQVLPRVNWRPSNEAEPVVSAHPALTVTDDLAKVGGDVGTVTLRNKVVFRIRGPQDGGLTAEERADLLSKRLRMDVYRLHPTSDSDISVAPVPSASGKPQSSSSETAAGPTKAGKPAASDSADQAPAQILIDQTPVITVGEEQAKEGGFRSPELLADSWAKNVRAALDLPPPVQPAASAPAAASPASAPPPAPAATPAAAAPPAAAPAAAN